MRFNRSDIREAMVRIMTASSTRQQLGVWQSCNDGDDGHTLLQSNRDNKSFDGSWLPKDPSTCIFWSTIALGALIQGQPIESVSDFVVIWSHSRRSLSHDSAHHFFCSRGVNTTTALPAVVPTYRKADTRVVTGEGVLGACERCIGDCLGPCER